MPLTVPRTLFDPILTGAGPVETTNCHWRLIRNCGLDALVLEAIETARRETGIEVDPALAACANPEIACSARLFRDGPGGMNPHEIAIGIQPIHNQVLHMAQVALRPITDQDGYMLDASRFATAMAGARRKIQAFLLEPKLGTTPRNSEILSLHPIVDRTSLRDPEGPRSFQVRMDGWSASLIERRHTGPWTRVTLTAPEETPEPGF
ncbi:hypothetical protein LAZ40_01555 [Cereibacter sphaeroides]|uniref:hypothetical protein n=1 Tax=Cereibacter sphaeroides TaxID=1063 RepID=UPI001F31680E|nr:hypothetical protein [Cereibacter sphaeroides]MCE6957746.1 hypothetical protein [Cereibacter sphaeroides]MCE6971628.1 hypothetical protein [Cereibacter sphaeroides]